MSVRVEQNKVEQLTIQLLLKDGQSHRARSFLIYVTRS